MTGFRMCYVIISVKITSLQKADCRLNKAMVITLVVHGAWPEYKGLFSSTYKQCNPKNWALFLVSSGSGLDH